MLQQGQRSVLGATPASSVPPAVPLAPRRARGGPRLGHSAGGPLRRGVAARVAYVDRSVGSAELRGQQEGQHPLAEAMLSALREEVKRAGGSRQGPVSQLFF